MKKTAKILIAVLLCSLAVNAQQKLGPINRALENFMMDAAKKQGGIQTPSGLVYQIYKKGTGPNIKDFKTVKLKYRIIGMTDFGYTFESSKDKVVTLKVADLCAGFQEGLKFVPAGSKAVLYVRPKLCKLKNGKTIGNNRALRICIDELVAKN